MFIHFKVHTLKGTYINLTNLTVTNISHFYYNTECLHLSEKFPGDPV